MSPKNKSIFGIVFATGLISFSIVWIITNNRSANSTHPEKTSETTENDPTPWMRISDPVEEITTPWVETDEAVSEISIPWIDTKVQCDQEEINWLTDRTTINDDHILIIHTSFWTGETSAITLGVDEEFRFETGWCLIGYKLMSVDEDSASMMIYRECEGGETWCVADVGKF